MSKFGSDVWRVARRELGGSVVRSSWHPRKRGFLGTRRDTHPLSLHTHTLIYTLSIPILYSYSYTYILAEERLLRDEAGHSSYSLLSSLSSQTHFILILKHYAHTSTHTRVYIFLHTHQAEHWSETLHPTPISTISAPAPSPPQPFLLPWRLEPIMMICNPGDFP